MIKILFVISLAILFTACNGKKDSDDIYLAFRNFDSVKKNGGGKRFDTISYSKGVMTFFERNDKDILIKIKSTLDNRQYGHYFMFDGTGNFNNYRYMLGDSLHHSLEITKDKTKDKYTELGSPFVDYMENVREADKNKYSLMFSVFPRKNLKVLYSTDGIAYRHISLTESKIMPLVMEVDISCDQNIKEIFLKIEANGLNREMQGMADTRQFYDTVKFKKSE